VSCALDLGGDEGRLKGYRLEDFEDVFARYLPSRSVSTRELVLGPEKPGEIRDFELVISNPDHEMKNAEIPSNSARPHEFRSLRPLPESVSIFNGKNAPGKGRNHKSTGCRNRRQAGLDREGGSMSALDFVRIARRRRRQAER
jgi:hypothetical protein